MKYLCLPKWQSGKDDISTLDHALWRFIIKTGKRPETIFVLQQMYMTEFQGINVLATWQIPYIDNGSKVYVKTP